MSMVFNKNSANSYCPSVNNDLSSYGYLQNFLVFEILEFEYDIPKHGF